MVDAQASRFIKQMVNTLATTNLSDGAKLRMPKRGKYTTLGGIANELMLCRLDVQHPPASNRKSQLQLARFEAYRAAVRARLLRPGMIVKLHTKDDGVRLVTDFTLDRVIGRKLRLVMTDESVDKLTNSELIVRLRQPDLADGGYVINGELYVDTGMVVNDLAKAIQRVGVPDNAFRGFVMLPSYKLIDVRLLTG